MPWVYIIKNAECSNTIYSVNVLYTFPNAEHYLQPKGCSKTVVVWSLCTFTDLAYCLIQLPDLSALNKVLRTLDLSTNKLKGVPPSVCDLSSLKHLNLNGNRIGKTETSKLYELLTVHWNFLAL